MNAESRLSDGEHTIEYVGRYSNRPAMAECRIVDFDGNHVTFWYDEKEKFLNYRESIKKYFGYDPLICKQCGGEILLYSIT